VDISSFAVKAVAIKKSNKAFNILQTHFFSIVEEDDEDKKKLLVLSHLKTLNDLYADKEVKYIFCISQNDISTETLSFPFKAKYKIMKALPYEIEEKLSLFDYKNLISDIKFTQFSDGKQDILVFSSFKKTIEELLNDVQSVGIKPFIFTCEASAATNLFEDKNIYKNKTPTKPEQGSLLDSQIYLKIGHTQTMAMIFSGGVLRNVYSFEWGVSSCIRKISVKYEIPLKKATEYFFEKAFILTQTKGYKGSQIEFSKVIQESFFSLVDKLKLLLLQIEGEKKYKCKKIFIYGGGSQVRNLQTFLSVSLNIPVSRVEGLVNGIDWNLRSNEERENNLAIALGAAMEGLKKSKKSPINFLQQEFAIEFNPLHYIFNQWRQPIVFGASVLVLLSLYATLKNNKAEKLYDETNKVFKKQAIQIAKLSPKQINIEKVQSFIKKQKEQVKQIQLVKEIDNLPSALDKVKNLSLAIEKKEDWNLEIKNLKIIGDRVEIQGTIENQYLRNLEKNLKNLAVKDSLKKTLLSIIDQNKLDQIKQETIDHLKKPKEDVASVLEKKDLTSNEKKSLENDLYTSIDNKAHAEVDSKVYTEVSTEVNTEVSTEVSKKPLENDLDTDGTSKEPLEYNINIAKQDSDNSSNVLAKETETETEKKENKEMIVSFQYSFIKEQS